MPDFRVRGKGNEGSGHRFRVDDIEHLRIRIDEEVDPADCEYVAVKGGGQEWTPLVPIGFAWTPSHGLINGEFADRIGLSPILQQLGLGVSE